MTWTYLSQVLIPEDKISCIHHHPQGCLSSVPFAYHQVLPPPMTAKPKIQEAIKYTTELLLNRIYFYQA